MELKVKGKDGKELWIQYVSTVSYAEGVPRRATVIVHDITARKETEERERNYTRSLEFLNATAEAFVHFSVEENIHEFIGRKLNELVEDSFVILNSYEKGSDALCVRAVVGMGDQSGQVLGLLGESPVGMCFRIDDPHGKEALLRGKLVEGPEGLFELSFGAIPREVCRRITETLAIREIHATGFVYQGELLGSAIILLKKQGALSDRSTLEAFISQASMALQRRATEEELNKAGPDIQKMRDR
jgi:hypothetical protein